MKEVREHKVQVYNSSCTEKPHSRKKYGAKAKCWASNTETSNISAESQGTVTSFLPRHITVMKKLWHTAHSINKRYKYFEADEQDIL